MLRARIFGAFFLILAMNRSIAQEHQHVAAGARLGTVHFRPPAIRGAEAV